MAIYTKHGERISNESLRVDNDCMFNGQIIKVWAKVVGEPNERQYWFSDLRCDQKGEIQSVLKANSKTQKHTE